MGKGKERERQKENLPDFIWLHSRNFRDERDGKTPLREASLIMCEEHWYNQGGDLTNSRYAKEELLINPRTIQKLKLKWKFFTGKDISATPAIANGVVYFPAWNGFLYTVNAFNGAPIWKQNLSVLTGLPAAGNFVNVTVARATPKVAGDLLIVGLYGPAVVIAVTRSTGNLVWITQLDAGNITVITASHGVNQSLCFLFNNCGASIWGSSPSIDKFRGLVYAATGQLYTAPPAVLECQAKQNNQTTPIGPNECIEPDIHYDSILALDLNSGEIRWARQLGGYDVFQFACSIPNNPDCPPGPNLDADFGEAPMMLTIFPKGKLRDVVVAVQKSRFAWALDLDTGPGSLEGGGIWGAATDGKRVYTNIVNANRLPFKLAPTNQTTNVGLWTALDADTGDILWSTANPSNDSSQGPVTLTNGVLFAGSVAPTGPIYAMDATTGTILWSYDTGATVYGGASASYGCIYIGHGFKVALSRFHPTWTSGDSLYAFCIA
ncbi:hypothetical protein RJ639_040644 [Escallonia herrerae]|uniref:Pyrrolo-quinoline quinone repeat domain-containing protein n=1 Tax=Escallonia herrerae TaxID=1293975 RepID=A0AA88WGD2_9ASTE|nr:hypothetical protein RJ639_040644 [Escallonia herrerae]